MSGDYRPEDLVGKHFFKLEMLSFISECDLKKKVRRIYIKQVVILLQFLAMLLFQSRYTTVSRFHKIADKKKIEFI